MTILKGSEITVTMNVCPTKQIELCHRKVIGSKKYKSIMGLSSTGTKLLRVSQDSSQTIIPCLLEGLLGFG